MTQIASVLAVAVLISRQRRGAYTQQISYMALIRVHSTVHLVPNCHVTTIYVCTQH